MVGGPAHGKSYFWGSVGWRRSQPSTKRILLTLGKRISTTWQKSRAAAEEVRQTDFYAGATMCRALSLFDCFDF